MKYKSASLSLVVGFLSGLASQAFAKEPTRPGLYYFCYCKEAGKGFEPRQARVIYNILSNGVAVDHHRVGDAAFFETGPNQYRLSDLAEANGETPVSYDTKQPCLDIFYGNENKICDGDVRTGTVDEDEI